MFIIYCNYNLHIASTYFK